MTKKGKVMKIFKDMEVFNLFVSYELCTIKTDALGELVKCKSSKNIFQTNFPENPDISNFLATFQRRLPDMSGSSTLT
jgi:5'-3' exonuclease